MSFLGRFVFNLEVFELDGEKVFKWKNMSIKALPIIVDLVRQKFR